PLPFASVLRDAFIDAIANGDANKDWSAIARVAARKAGLEDCNDGKQLKTYTTPRGQNRWVPGHGYRWQRRIHLRSSGELGKTPARLVIQGNRRRRRGPARQRLCLQSRRASDDRVRLRWQFPALIRRRYVSPCPRRLYGARGHDLAHRRWRPHRPPVHAGRKGAADPGHFRQAGTLHERGAVSSLYPHRNVSAGRHLCVRRLWQFARAQIRAEWKAAPLLGRAWH